MDRHPFVKLPLGWGKVLLNRIYDWGYDGEPQDTMAGRRIECARGKVVGGSSTINAMAYARGNRADYARWTSYGLRGWSYDDVLPYFRRQESWEGGASHYRGGDGPMATRKSVYRDPLVDAYLEAAAGSGYQLNEDYNGERQDGFARMQMTIRNGRRESAATAYLHPALRRKNLTVTVRAHVARVVLEGMRAVGVEYIEDSQRRLARAEREVIVSAGAINSPQILMLSGIGDPQALAAHGITVKAALPGVGRNLQDHAAALLIYSRADQSPPVRNMRADRLALGIAEAFALGSGFMTDLPGGITGFVKTDASKPMPDIQLLFIAGSLAAAPYLPPSASHSPTASPAASCCCGRKAAAALRSAQRILLVILASTRGCCRRPRTGQRCARALPCFANWPPDANSNHSSHARSAPEPMLRPMRKSKLIRGKPR